MRKFKSVPAGRHSFLHKIISIVSQVREMKPAYLGFALYVVFHFFYIHDAAPLIGEAGFTEVYVVWYFVALFFTKLVTSLVSAVVAYRNPLQEQRSLIVAASIFMGIGLLVLTVILRGTSFSFGSSEMLLLLLGSGVLLGIGDSLMIALWGYFSSTLPMRNTYIFVLASYLIALIFSSVVSLLPLLVLAGCIAAGCTVLPFLFKKSMKNRPDIAPQKPKRKTAFEGISKTWRYITLTALFAFLSNFTLVISSHQTLDAQAAYTTATLVTFGVVLVMLLIALLSSKEFDIDLTYRFALPLAAGGLLLLGFLWNSGGGFANSMVAMGWLLSDLATWCVVSTISARLKMHPFILFGVSQAVFSLTVILGVTGGYLFADRVGHEAISLMTAALIGIYLLSMALVFLLKDRRAHTLIDEESPRKTSQKQDSTAPKESRATQSKESLPAQQVYVVHDRVQEQVQELSKQTDLTARETDILGFLAQGRSTQYMAATLFLSENTVKSHVKNVYRKLGVHSKQEVISIINSK